MKSLCYAVALCAVPVAAQARVEVDQVNLVTVPAGSYVGGSSIFQQPSFAIGRFGQMQSVTAGKDGLLTRIDLQIFRVGTANPTLPLSITLVDGEPGADGVITQVGTVSFSRSDLPIATEVDAGAVFSVDVSGFGYRVVNGQKFSIMFSMPPGDTGPTGPTLNGGYWALGYNTPSNEFEFAETFLNYDRGFNTLLEGNGARLVSGVDRGFRTYVDVAGVPEPASWAMMILGLGGVGAAVRRRDARIRFA